MKNSAVITVKDLLEGDFDPNATVLDLSDLFLALNAQAMEHAYFKYAMKLLAHRIKDIKKITHLKLNGIKFTSEQAYSYNYNERVRYSVNAALYYGLYNILLREIDKRAPLDYNAKADLEGIDFANTDVAIIMQLLPIFKNTIMSRNRNKYDIGGFNISTDNKQDAEELQKLYHAENEVEFDKGVKVKDSLLDKPRPSLLKTRLWYFASILTIPLKLFIFLSLTLFSIIKFIIFRPIFNAGKFLYTTGSNYFRSKYVAKTEEITDVDQNKIIKSNSSIEKFYCGTDTNGKQLVSHSSLQLPFGSAVCSLVAEELNDASNLGIKFLIQTVPGAFADDDAQIKIDDILNCVRNAVHLAIKNQADHLLIPLIGSAQFLLKRIKLSPSEQQDTKKYELLHQFFINPDNRRGYFDLKYFQAVYEEQIVQYLPILIIDTVRKELAVYNQHNIKSILYFDYGARDDIHHYDQRYDQQLKRGLSLFEYALKQSAPSNINEVVHFSDPIVWLKSNIDKNSQDSYALIMPRDAQLGIEAARANRQANRIYGPMLAVNQTLGDEALNTFENYVARRWQNIAITTTQAQVFERQRALIFSKPAANGNLLNSSASLQNTDEQSLDVPQIPKTKKEGQTPIPVALVFLHPQL